MHHPGPPRFVAVGDGVELAPRDPDPGATFSWRIATAPADSTAEVGEEPVEHLVPDAPGRYVVELTAPDGTHRQTVRAFPADHAVGGGGRSGPVGVSAEGSESAARPGRSAGEGSARASDAGSAPGGRPRLGLSTTVDDETVVVRAHPRAHPEGLETATDLDVEFVLDDRDSLSRADVTVSGRELSIPIGLFEDEVRVHAVAVGQGGYSVPDAVTVTHTGAGDEEGAIRTVLPYHPPAWAEDAVIYEVYVRTFPGQESPLAGGRPPEADRSVFDAIVDRLDYIADLGVDALWLTPVLENDHADHGYNVTDFFAIAEDLGTRADYERLIEAANERGLKVLFDLVCNHSARDHPHFQAAVADPNSEYREWYEWRGPTDPETYFDWEYIANFDFTHLPVRRHLLDAVETWAPLVDGFRCDMAWAVPNGFWREIHDRLAERDPEFLLLDETIPYVPDFQGGLFDVHFDSTTYAALRRVGRGDDPADAVLDAIDERTRIGFPDHAGYMLYAENHDETRYVVECGRPAAKAALGALFTLPGAPMVYAGQEFGQRGQRDPLAWGHVDEALQEHVRELADARTDRPALAGRADLQRIDYEVREGAADPVMAFVRTAPEGTGPANTDDAVAVVLNFGDDDARVALDVEVGDVDLVTGAAVGTPDGVRVEDVTVLSARAASLPTATDDAD